MQVALKQGSDAQSSSFSRSWTVPRVVIQTLTGPIGLLHIVLLVADNDLTEEDILLGRPVSTHLGIDSITLLAQHRSGLDGTDCALVNTHTPGTRSVGQLMLVRLQQVEGSNPLPVDGPTTPLPINAPEHHPSAALDPQRERIDYNDTRN